MRKELNIVGHIVLDDKIFIEDKFKHELKSQLGGPPSFASMAIGNNKIETRILTSIGKDFPVRYLDYFGSFSNIDLQILESQYSTRFIHKIYQNSRKLFIRGQAAKLDNYVEVYDGGKICLLSPVFNEINQTAINWAKDKHDIVALDVQGFMREDDGTGRIIPKSDKTFLTKNLSQLDFVKFSMYEAINYTGKESFSDILRHLPEENIQIVTMGERGLIYSNKGSFFKMNAPKTEEVDPTGAGDVLMVSLLTKLQTNEDFDYSLAYAMAIAAEKVKYEKIEPIKAKKFEKIAEEILETKIEID